MKYRVTAKMPTNASGYVAGDMIEPTPENAVLLLAKGYIEPLGMEAAKHDKMVKNAKHK